MSFPLEVSPSLLLPRQQLGRRSSLHFLARNRYQLLGAVLIAVLLPALMSGELSASRRPFGITENTAVGTLIATLLGAYLLRRLTGFPRAPRYAYVLPAFLATYGGALALFAFLLIDYSKSQFAASFVAALLWHYFVLRVERPIRRPCLLVLPGGDAEGLLENPEADWHIAVSPNVVPDGTTGVVADLRADLSPAWQKFLGHCAQQGLPIHHSKQVREWLTGRVKIEHLSENSLASSVPFCTYMRLKRLFDILGALVAAPLAVPLILSTAAIVKLIDGGPVMFCQARVGFRGKVFTIYKFRTMHVATQLGHDFTKDHDPRITRLGRLLRRYRIDEVPQIINILKGDMSWIGPRPESVALSEWYEKHIPFYSYRHIVRPGITGWAQVNQGNVAMIEEAALKLQYDFYYIKHFSPWIELLIAARTISVVFSGHGAR